MRSDHWKITLESYLDGELSPAEAKTFRALAAANPEVAAELESRLAMRARWRRALGQENVSPPAPRKAPSPRILPARTFIWLPAALAACLLLAVGLPRLTSHSNHAGNPLTSSGQVSALRYGEHPGQTVLLEAGSLELPAEFNR